jgi:hypothetical protein
MRYMALCVFLAAMSFAAVAEESVQGITGPAAPTILRYLSTTKATCPVPARTGCTISSLVLDASTFYGRFPGDPSNYAVAFAITDTGGSGGAMTAFVWREARPSESLDDFVLIGTAGVFGADPRDVSFGAGHSITWIGTVINPVNSHCCATGKRTMYLKVLDRGLSFLDK